MRCEEVQDLASAWLDNELSEARARMVAGHEARCAECHAYVTDLRRAITQVARLAREPAPSGLETRLRGLLAAEAGPDLAAPVPAPWRHGFFRQAAALAAVCLLSIATTWAVMHQREAAPGAQMPGAQMPGAQYDVVTAHVRSLLQDSPIQVASSDQHTVRPWFNGRVEFAPPVKDLAAEGFQLIGGRLDYVEGHRVAALVYRRRLHTISVFVWPEAVPGASVWRPVQQSGLNLLSWSKDGMVWWAVSDLNPEELRELRALL